MNDFAIKKLAFASDYMEGAHPSILKRLAETNFDHSDGYGLDTFCESAREKIRTACGCENAEIHFLSGGTQANSIIISAILKSYQGVIACDTGHVSVHEAGAIEAGGHKVLTIPANDGKLSAEAVEQYIDNFYADLNNEHMVMPGMAYISHPTELGTLYSLKELTELSEVCKKNHLPLYLDGARLAAALACPENDVSLKDIAELCDIFYIGGTKCGAIFGEAVVMPDPTLIPHFFTIIKQRGALLAKGRILGLQFDTLFSDDLYLKCGKNSIETADRLRKALKEKGARFYFETPTNQIFVIMDDDQLKELAKHVDYSFWEKYDETHTAIRFATSWATTMEDVERLIELL